MAMMRPMRPSRRCTTWPSRGVGGTRRTGAVCARVPFRGDSGRACMHQPVSTVCSCCAQHRRIDDDGLGHETGAVVDVAGDALQQVRRCTVVHV